MSDIQLIRFRLNLSYDQYLAVYQGFAKTISVVADDGRSIVFPAGKVQSYLTKNGIQGHFEMSLGTNNKFLSLKKLD